MKTELSIQQRTFFSFVFCLAAIAVTCSIDRFTHHLSQQGRVMAQTIEQVDGEERFRRELPLASGGQLSVENFKGKIHVEGWDKDAVAVDVYKRFEGNSSKRRQWLSETKVNFDQSADAVRIKVEYPHHNQILNFNWDEYQGAVELIIKAPRRVNLDLEGHKPEVNVSRVHGSIRIRSHKSPINIESTVGAININTHKETIKMRDVDIEQRLDVQIHKGDVEIDARDIGDLVTFDTHKANIVLRLPAGVGLNVDVDGGRRANFVSDFPVTLTTQAGGDRIRGRIEGGGPELQFRTDKGSLALRRR